MPSTRRDTGRMAPWLAILLVSMAGLLLEVSWNPGPDQCDAPDERYRLYGR